MSIPPTTCICRHAAKAPGYMYPLSIASVVVLHNSPYAARATPFGAPFPCSASA
uniref:Uncharacterized protein n=1 Tax=Arundo donax TaxID=35708 RepID=A0A0A9F968_ARUDO